MLPDEFTLEEKMIPVSDGHELYAQLWGNAGASETIVFLHGGPGSGCDEGHKGYFDPTKQRVLFFDQRGSGKSLPHGSLQSNTTDKLIEDMQVVTKVFGVETFVITGGSWGSTLALAYAIKYPEKVTRMVLRGIFLGTKQEIDFFDKGLFRPFFPDAWQTFVQSVPEEYQNDPSSYHLERILGNDRDAAKKSAYEYSKLVSAVVTIEETAVVEDFEAYDPTSVIIECHYTSNSCFLTESYIIDNAGMLTMPISLIQGRYDALCPPTTAYNLAQKLPDAQLYWTVAGHSGSDPANRDMTLRLLNSD